MTVALKTLRVNLEGDSSNYARAAKDKADADRRMISSADALRDAQARLGVSTDKTSSTQVGYGRGLDRTIGSLDKSHTAALQLQRTHTSLQGAVDRGRISKERYDQLMGLAAVRYQRAIGDAQTLTTTHDRLGRQFTVAQGQLQGFAAQLGPAGLLLSSFGAAGLVTAATVGVIVLGLHQASQAASKFATDMGKLRDSSEILGLTTLQLQAVADKGSEFALTEEKISTGLQRFVSGLEELRRGQGNLFEILQRTDPALAQQLAGIRDTATALDIMAKAYGRANEAQRAALSRAAFGRTGFDVGLLVQSIGKVGGVDALTEDFRRSGDAIDAFMIERVRLLHREIADMSEDSSRNLAAIFSVRLLEMQRESTSLWRDFTRAARTFEMSTDLRAFLDKISSATPTWFENISWLPWLAKMLPVMQEMRTPGFIPPDPMTAARRNLAAGLRSGETFDAGKVWSPFATDEETKFKQSAEFRFNVMRQWMSLLGSAATPAEQLRLKELELAAAAEKLGIGHEIVSRALSEFAQKQRDAEVATRSRHGVATEEEMLQVKIAEINRAVADGFIRTETERTEAMRRATIAAREQYLAMSPLAALQERLKFEQQTSALSDTERGVAQEMRRVHGDLWPQYMQSREAAQLRWLAYEKQALDYAQSAGQAILSALSQGKSGNEAVRGAVNAVGTKLSGDLMSAGIATGNPAAIGGALIISWMQGQAVKAEEARKKFEAAQEAWTNMAGTSAPFVAELVAEQPAQSMIEAADQRPTGVHRGVDNVNTTGRPTGNARPQALRRLRDHRPDLKQDANVRAQLPRAA